MAKQVTKAELEEKVAYLERCLLEAEQKLEEIQHPPAQRRDMKFCLTVALGVAIPALSLCLTNIAGSLAGGGCYLLAGFASMVGGCVLLVSLSHLASAIGEITRSGWRSSLALAISLDCSLVLSELVFVYAQGLGLEALCWAMMLVVCVFSMSFNVFAFLAHK